MIYGSATKPDMIVWQYKIGGIAQRLTVPETVRIGWRKVARLVSILYHYAASFYNTSVRRDWLAETNEVELSEQKPYRQHAWIEASNHLDYLCSCKALFNSKAAWMLP